MDLSRHLTRYFELQLNRNRVTVASNFHTCSFEYSFDNISICKSIRSLHHAPYPYEQELALKLILSLVTVTENVSQNTILEYLMIHPNLFDTVVKLLASPNLRVPHGYDALLLLTILVSKKGFMNMNALWVPQSASHT